jgi:hypothetical protein
MYSNRTDTQTLLMAANAARQRARLEEATARSTPNTIECGRALKRARYHHLRANRLFALLTEPQQSDRRPAA